MKKARLKTQYVEAVVNCLTKTALSYPPSELTKPIELPEGPEGAQLVAFAMPFYFNVTIPAEWFDFGTEAEVVAPTQPGADA